MSEDKKTVNVSSNAANRKPVSGRPKKMTRNVAPKKIIEPMEMINTDAGVVTFKDGIKEDEVSEIEIVSNLSGLKEKTAQLAFYEEPLVINIHESSDMNAPEKYVFLSVNGRGAGPNGLNWVPRGQNVTVARKYVEVLARARPAKYDSIEKVNEVGDREVIYPRSSSLRYPFSVISDPNPKGAAWLSKLLRER